MLPHLKAVLDVDLENTGVHPAALEETAPVTAIKALFSESGHRAGVWECGPGKYRLERKTDEFCVILDGHWLLTGDDGDSYELKAGDTILLRKGWKGLSHILKTIRKVYITWE
jgi:uncharacterized cupin superfamily protein